MPIKFIFIKVLNFSKKNVVLCSYISIFASLVENIFCYLIPMNLKIK